jgi:insulin-like growth factor 2 receptor
LIYWNGIINLTFTEGTSCRSKEQTPRKSQIAFICDPHIGKGHPEFDGERDHSYFFRWYTSLACPHAPKTVHCVWDNGSHIVDLTQLSNTQGNHFTVGIRGVPAI